MTILAAIAGADGTIWVAADGEETRIGSTFTAGRYDCSVKLRCLQDQVVWGYFGDAQIGERIVDALQPPYLSWDILESVAATTLRALNRQAHSSDVTDALFVGHISGESRLLRVQSTGLVIRLATELFIGAGGTSGPCRMEGSSSLRLTP
jgi:hypothetical protein